MSKSTKAEKKALELRQLAAEAAKAELELESARLRFSEDKFNHVATHQQMGDITGTFYFSDAVTDSSCARLASRVRRYAQREPGKPITIVIQSPGGGVLPGLGLYDELRAVSDAGSPITTQVRGYAASFGAILLQAGDTRLVGPESYLMVHEISAGTGGKLHEMRDEVEFYERINRRLFDIMSRRSGGKFNARSLYSKAKAKDLWLDAEEAVEKYGLADAIG